MLAFTKWGSDLLKGKEKTYKADPLAKGINGAANDGLNIMSAGANSLNNQFYKEPNKYIDNQIGMENRLLRNASDDASRRTRQLISQRGMQNSSIGLGQEVNQNRTLSDKLALNNASGMERLRGLLNDQMKTGSQLMAPKLGQGPMQMNDIKQRSGGLASLAGAAAGAYVGGPAGAQIGAGLGQAYQNS